MYYIGLDIGGTKCASTLGEIEMGLPKILDKDYFLTDNQPPQKILDRFARVFENRKK